MSDQSQHLIAEGDRLLRAGQVDAARDAFRQVLKSGSDDLLALKRLAGLELHVCNPKDAVPLLQKLSELQPDEPDLRLELAAAQEDARDLEGAEQTLRALSADFPDHAAAHNNLGNLLQVREAFDEAFAAYARTIELRPDLAAAWVNAGNALDELSRHAEAVEHYSRAIELDPNRAEIHYFRARARTALGEAEAALADVEQCLKRDPADQKGLALQGVLFAALGRHEEEKRLFDYDRFVRRMHPEPPQGFATIEAFNEALIGYIRNDAALAYDPYGVSTHGGWHSGNLLADAHPLMRSLRSMLQTMFQKYVSELPSDNTHPFLRPNYANLGLVAQAQVLESKGWLETHIHPGGWISSAYYLAVPDVVASGADKPGWIEFGHPITEIKCDAELEIRAYEPRPGTAVLFPSYFFHGTRPFQSEQERISIGIDLIPRG